MNKPSSRLAKSAAWLFAAALGSGVAAPAEPCNAGVCKVVITVQACDAPTMTATPDPVPVDAPNNIEWSIDTPGYKFADDGIVIAGSGFTPRPGVNGNGNKFSVHDDHSDLRPDIKYTVNLIRSADGVACKAFDPLINNH